uniref:Lipocalin/cytosolic fatty-acid binding domain-containing protein n=1 Tax=Monodelphis domestica TaxID=13616 RepID=A0A5F8H151_MONDO
MKTALLCVLLGIFTMLKAEERSLDLDKFSGFWYEVGMSSNSKMLLKKKDTKRLGAIIITPASNGLHLKIINDDDHVCVREDFLGVQSENQEKFIISETREFIVLDTDYDTYAIMKLSYEDKGQRHHVLQLLCRDLDIVLEGYKKLRKTSEQFGISKKNAVIFIYDDTCPKILSKDLQ